MFVINEMTRELLMTASEDGLIRIWDPGYSLHSYEFDSAQRLITSTFLLKGVQWSYMPTLSTYWCEFFSRHGQTVRCDCALVCKNCVLAGVF